MLSRNTPDALVVTIEAPLCFTPLQDTQLWVPTIVTTTPLLFSQILSTALWIADVSCSWIAPRLPNNSTIRLSFDKPITLPSSPTTYPICTTPCIV